jgi:hypothetical protein
MAGALAGNERAEDLSPDLHELARRELMLQNPVIRTAFVRSFLGSILTSLFHTLPNKAVRCR